MATSGGGILGAFVGGLGGGAIGSAVVRLYLDTTQYTGQLAAAQGQTEAAGAQMGAAASEFSGAWLAAGTVAAAAVAKFAVSSIQAALEQEQAQAKLANAVQNSTLVTGASIPVFNAQAAALRDTTGASDEAINGAQALLVQMGLTAQQVTQLTPLINDLSVKMGIDLSSAAKAVGKAAEGSTGALARYVGPIEKGTTAAQTYANVLQKLGAVQGYAAQQAKIEPWKILAEQFHEFEEQIGLQLVPALQKMSEVLIPIAETVLPKLASAIGNVLGPVGDLAQAIDDLANHKMPDVTSAIAGLLKIVALVNPSYKEAAAQAQALADAQDQATGAMQQGTVAGAQITNTVNTYSPAVMGAANNVYRWGKDMLYTNGVLNTATSAVQSNTTALKANNAALQAEVNAQYQAAGGIIAVAGAFQQLQTDLKTVNQLQRQGKTDTNAYDQAVLKVAGDQLAWRQQVQQLKQDLRDGNVTVEEARSQLRAFALQAGLSKDSIKGFVNDALGPAIDKLGTFTEKANAAANAIRSIPSSKTIRLNFVTHGNLPGQVQPI